MRRVLVTGAGGQLGVALADAFAADDVQALTRSDWDVRYPAPATVVAPDLVLHTDRRARRVADVDDVLDEDRELVAAESRHRIVYPE